MLMKVDLGLFFFFQAEDGIRDVAVTGVQTCALPIFHGDGLTVDGVDRRRRFAAACLGDVLEVDLHLMPTRRDRNGAISPRTLLRRSKIGRASCRERV